MFGCSHFYFCMTDSAASARRNLASTLQVLAKPQFPASPVSTMQVLAKEADEHIRARYRNAQSILKIEE